MRRPPLDKLAKFASRIRAPKSADVLGVTGIASLTSGAALIYLPAGLILLGVLLLVISVGLDVIPKRGNR